MEKASKRMSTIDDLRQVFSDEGVDHWMEKVLEILELPNLKLLKHVTREEFDKVLVHVKHSIEKRALLEVFQTIKGTNEMSKENDAEVEIRDIIKSEGLDDKIWVTRIEKELNIDTIRLLPTLDLGQFELTKVANPTMRSVLEKLLTRFTEVNRADDRIVGARSDPERPLSQNLTAAQIVRDLQGGSVCRGICVTDDMDEISRERDSVIDVSDDLEFADFRSAHPVFHHEFTSEITSSFFEANLDKHIPARSGNDEGNIWGISLQALSSTRSGTSCPQKTYVSSIHYQMFPARSVHLTPNNIQLRPEVVGALVDIEHSLKDVRYEPEGHFRDFFSRYGSHVNNGDVECGGMLISIAHSKCFEEQERSNITAIVTETAERALLLCISDEVQVGEPLNAYEILGKTSNVCSEDLANITVTVRKVGGLQNPTDKFERDVQMLANSHLWKVICRNSPPIPIWRILQKERVRFENIDKFTDAMKKETKKFLPQYMQMLEENENGTENTLSPNNEPQTSQNGNEARKLVLETERDTDMESAEPLSQATLLTEQNNTAGKANLLADKRRKEEGMSLAKDRRIGAEQRKEEESRLSPEEQRKEEDVRLLAEGKRIEEATLSAEGKRKEEEAKLLAEEKRKESPKQGQSATPQMDPCQTKTLKKKKKKKGEKKKQD